MAPDGSAVRRRRVPAKPGVSRAAERGETDTTADSAPSDSEKSNEELNENALEVAAAAYLARGRGRGRILSPVAEVAESEPPDSDEDSDSDKDSDTSMDSSNELMPPPDRDGDPDDSGSEPGSPLSTASPTRSIDVLSTNEFQSALELDIETEVSPEGDSELPHKAWTPSRGPSLLVLPEPEFKPRKRRRWLRFFLVFFALLLLYFALFLTFAVSLIRLARPI